jgi:hypothetical protein
MSKENAPDHAEPGLSRTILWIGIIYAGWALMGGLAGAFIVPFFLEGFFKIFDGEDDPSHNRWLLALVFGGLNVVLAAGKDLVRARRRKGMRRAARDLGLEVAGDAGEKVEEALEDLFGADGGASLDNVMRKDMEGGRCLVGDLDYATKGSEPGELRHHRQTVAYFEADDMALPQFDLQPEGIALRFLSAVAGLGDIDFPDRPRFSDQYHLSGLRADRIRRLFEGSLLEYFTRHPGFQVIGQKSRLAVFRPGRHCSPEDLDEFIEQAREIFRRFRKASLRGAERRERTTPLPPRDPGEALKGLPGAVRWSLQARLVTPEMLDAFLAEPPPRKVPSKIKAQHLGSGTLIPATVGTMFFLGGCGMLIFGVILRFEKWSSEVLLMSLISAALLLIGFPLGFLSWHYRWWNMRLLKRGKVTEGTIEEVEDTKVAVDGWKRYRVLLRYRVDGREYVQNSYIYGDIFKEAERLMKAKASVRILYDPRQHRRVIWAGSMITVIPGAE